MLGLKAKAGLLFFVSAGIFVGLVVFGNAIAPKKISPVPEKQDLSTTAQVTDLLQNAIGPTSPFGLFEASEPKDIDTINTGANLTRNLASLIGKSIVDKNPEGPQNGNISVANANKITDETIAQSINTADLSNFYPILSSSELLVGPNTNWTEDIQTVFKTHINTLKQKIPSASFKDNAKTASLIYESSISNLKQIITPTERIAQQQQLLSLLMGEQYALQSIEQYESDPIRGIVALHMLQELELKLQHAQSQL